ncbi:MAG TPA: DinB family protein [Ktedonobacteraceae bacterium]|jgi:uncharacterized damage-inducible protein DinB|nr:DinB family protein [Ktedonobacteraceae bacterium]
MTTSPANPKVEAIRKDAQQSYNALLILIDGPLAQLPPEQLYVSPGNDEWTIMENLAHIVEFLSYWANEVAALVAEPGKNFGRTMQHEGRLAAIRDHAHDTLEQIKSALPASYGRLESVLYTLQDSDLDITGHHVKYGDKPLSWFIEEFITGHLRAHLQQMQEAAKQVG